MNISDQNGKVIRLNSKNATAYNAAADRESNYIGERIAEERIRQKISLSSFSNMLKEYGVEIGPTGINKWEMGKTVPNGYQLFAIACALGLEDELGYFMSITGTLNEEGRRKLNEYKDDLIATGKYDAAPRARKPAIKYIYRPVSYLSASAGTGAFLDEGQFENVRFPESAVPSGADFALHVSGDSMEPVYHDGQIVWVKKCERLKPGEVGIFVYEGNGYIKAYDEQEPEDDIREEFTDSYGNVRMQPVMVSYNERYEPILISPDALFQIVGRVL